MDQQKLDDAYDQVVYAPNRDRPSSPAIQQRACPHRLGEPLRFSYGPSPYVFDERDYHARSRYQRLAQLARPEADSLPAAGISLRQNVF
jgi:hypothetical protein